MTGYDIPGRVSDAGPADPVEARDWSEWCLEAEDSIRLARRTERDNLPVERKLRREAIWQAQEALRRALELL